MRHFFTQKACVLFIVAVMMGFPAMVRAMEPGSPILKFTGEVMADAEIDESGPTGEVQKTCSEGALTIPIRLDDQSNLKLEIGYGQTAYDWTATERISFGNGREPWDKLHHSGMALNYMHHRNQNWSLLAGVDVGAAWEDQKKDAYTFGGRVGVIYRGGSDVSWIIGAGVLRWPEETLVYPMLGVRWNQGAGPGEHPYGWSASLGAPKTEIRYAFNEVLAAHCHVEMEMVTYRLADDSNVSPSGLVEMSGFSSGFFLDIRPMKPMKVSVGVTYQFGREWEIQDKDGDTIRTVEIEGAVGARMALSWTF